MTTSMYKYTTSQTVPNLPRPNSLILEKSFRLAVYCVYGFYIRSKGFILGLEVKTPHFAFTFEVIMRLYFVEGVLCSFRLPLTEKLTLSFCPPSTL